MPNYPGHDVAEAAFDVMMRRGWSPHESPIEGEGWRVDTWGDYFAFTEDGQAHIGEDNPSDAAHWPDPFTALVEADRWYKENVERAEVQSDGD